MYDLVVIGAGLAGLHVAVEWLTRHPHTQCALVERYPAPGGRIHTHHETVPGRGRLSWESGAGRISTRHHRVLGRLTHYGLTTTPLGTSWSSYPPSPNRFTDLADLYLPPLRRLPPHVLRTNTLASLFHRLAPKNAEWIRSFPYTAEFHTLRADLALNALEAGELHSPEGFVVCNEGLSTLVERMTADFLARGGILLSERTCLRVQKQRAGKAGKEGKAGKAGLSITLERKEDLKTAKETLHAHRVVLAMDAESLRTLHPRLPVLRHLASPPLLRIYAVFPVRNGKAWFSDLSTTVLEDSPLRFFIPVRPDKGVVMISYTEGADAEYWMKMPRDQRHQKVLEEARRVFTHHTIPDPLVMKSHPWKTGCTYWLPGDYDPHEESDASVQPVQGWPMYLCSESFAVEQSWMESALVQAEKVIRRL